MKKYSLIIFTMLFISKLNSQIIINEIMYNPPESGTDYLEFIEFFNAGSIPVNIKDYSIKDAVIFTFPDSLIMPKSYFVLAVDSNRLDSVFAVKAFKWTSGGLRNTDEVITLLDASSNAIDSVHYFSSWSNEANGNGSSLELCRSTVDNNNSLYWRPSRFKTSKTVNGKEVFATPGKDNSVVCADYTIISKNIEFTPSHIEIYVGEQIEWINQGGLHNVNGSTISFPSNPEDFFSGAPSSDNWSYIHKFNTAGEYEYQCDVHASSGMKGSILVRKKDLNYPDIAVRQLRTVNSDGVLDSLNKRCAIEGTVYGVNLRPVGLQFTIIDKNNDGIGVFLSSGNLNYTVKEGDLLRIKGMVSQFNGLAQMLPDSLQLVKQGNPLISPSLVSSLSESTESQLIEIKNVELVDPLSWNNNPLGFTVKITNGQDTFDLRVDDNVDLHGTAAPGGRFNVTGIGSQFDVASPFLDGYQIMPRYLSDIEIISSTNHVQKLNVEIFPNPASDNVFISTNMEFEYMEIMDLQGRIIKRLPFCKNIDLDIPGGWYFLKLMGQYTTFQRFLKLDY